MSRETSRYPQKPAAEGERALIEYLTKLEEIYPPAKGAANVVRRRDNRIIVTVPLPTSARERMRIFDQMAEVATELLIQTNQYIVLSAQ